MEAACWQGDEEVPCDKMQPTNLAAKRIRVPACILPILVPLHMYISFSVQQSYFCELEGYFFLKANTSFKSLYVQHLPYLGMYCVLANKIPFDFFYLSIISALLFQLPRMLASVMRNSLTKSPMK